MADLGQDADSLEIKVMEVEVTIGEKEFSKKRIALEQKKLEAKKKSYTQSLIDIDKQIKEHKEDLASLEEAFKEAKEAEVVV